MKRAECLRAVGPLVTDELVVTTAGGATNEWQAYGPPDGHLHVKTLGLCSSIGLGLALALPERKVIVLDGDGSLLMNLCGLPTIARQNPPNLVHVVFDNGVYESSGGTPTQTSSVADLAAIARGAGIRDVSVVENVEEFETCFATALRGRGLAFIHARIEPGREPLPPMRVDEVENKYRLVRFVERTEHISVLQRPSPARRQG